MTNLAAPLKSLRYSLDNRIHWAPGTYIGKKLGLRKDSCLVRFYYEGMLIKTHPVILPRKRFTDFTEYPKGKITTA